MTSIFLFKNLLGTLLLPPTNGLLPLLVAALFRRRRWAFGLALIGGTLLFLQSLPIVASNLVAPLEARAGGVFVSAQGARAIVVLGSGLRRDAPEYGSDTVNERSLVRLRYGATLARRLQLPVLITGGVPLHASRSEADVMAAIAEREFGVAVRWKESESSDTADNASMSAQILKPAGIRRVVLVTQAFHMSRARQLFEAAGLEVIPAPTDFKGSRDGPLETFDFLPQAKAIQTSYYALHEWLGLAWISLASLLGSG